MPIRLYRLLSLIIFSSLLCLFPQHSAVSDTSKPVTIVFSGDMIGYLDACP